MIMIVKTPESQMGSPAAADKGGEEMGGEKCESGESKKGNFLKKLLILDSSTCSIVFNGMK